MHWIRFSFYSFIGCVIIGNVKGTTSSAVPDLLYDCYRRNFTAISRPPLTVPLLVELIRKIELDDQNAFNMRILATSILHGIIFDGIRRVRIDNADETIAIPYRATAVQFNKYKLVVDYLTSGESSLFPMDSLSTPERCFLHKMLSNTVDPWERGDESSTCVHQSSMPLNIETMSEDDKISACPLKGGVIKTRWGPVSAGHIIAGVASALQQPVVTFQRIGDAINTTTATQDKNVTTDAAPPPTIITTNANNVNSVWVSTIAGDLAGVLLNQATITPTIGNDGFWNDTLLPRTYYLKSLKSDMTEADILGGIDAIIMGNNAKNWLSIATRMRLSQLIDMYYNNRGIATNEQSANRSVSVVKLLTEIKLDDQVAGTAKLLQKTGTYPVKLRENEIIQLSTIVAEKFKEVAVNVSKKYDSIEYIDGKPMKAPLEIAVIFDGSYDAYAGMEMLYALSEAVQVSYYGSKLGVINGQSGNWMANVTGELFQLFTDMQQAEHEWPATLSLGVSLETLIYYYENKLKKECDQGVSRPAARVILIVSPDGRLTDSDLKRSTRAFNTIKNANPDISVVYVASSETKAALSDFTKASFKDNDHVLTPPKDVRSLIENVAGTLADIPGNIVNFYCEKSHAVRLEDYITPGLGTSYQIRKEYIERTHIMTNLTNSDYGDLLVCAGTSKVSNKVCKSLPANGHVSFDSEQICMPDATCNVLLVVEVNETKSICSENDCRYPDQVRLDLTWAPSRTGATKPSLYIVVMLVFILLHKY